MNNQSFSTSDWYLAVWLLANDFELKGIDKSNPSRCQFLFKGNNGIEDSVKKFWTNGQVHIQDFIAAIKKTKSLLYSDSF